MEKEETPSGILVGGTDSGSVVLWNPVKILNGETDDAVLIQNDKHTGMFKDTYMDPKFSLTVIFERMLLNVEQRCKKYWTLGTKFSTRNFLSISIFAANFTEIFGV